MMLDGKASLKDKPGQPSGEVDLVKVPGPSFNDEWDFVIDNYTIGANDPYIIDSIGMIASRPAPEVITAPVIAAPLPSKPDETVMIERKAPAPPPVIALPAPKPQTIEDKFTSRKKVFTKEILLEGDSLELRFYDNAEVDGDSISLFLNDQLIFSHIRLTDKPYTIRMAIKDLNDTNELIMVAENLGSIPPNTSYMVALVGEQRYDAMLASTENSSAMIRLTKK